MQNQLDINQKIIIGATSKNFSNYFNSLFLISKKNNIKFDKKILVPFGEFIPFRNYIKFMESIAGTSDFSTGKNNRYIKINDHLSFLPVICYEIIFFWKLLEKNNTNIIINLTNDSWFGTLLGPYQHFYFARLRAAEFNKSVIRVSGNGVSGVIDNNGIVKRFIKLGYIENSSFNLTINPIENNYLSFHKILFFLIIFTFILGIFFNKKYE